MPLREKLNNLFLDLYFEPNKDTKEAILNFFDQNVNYIKSKEIVRKELRKALSLYVLKPNNESKAALESYRTNLVNFIYKS